MSRRSMLTRLGLLAAMIAALFATSATLAFAGPSEATMTVTQLQANIDASGTLDGHLLTVDSRDTTISIRVHIIAVTSGFSDGPPDMSSLIYFKAYGTEIDEIGGIAAGMSGSPIYVEDGTGTDKLIGALSYGDVETLHGAGLATPIEAMAGMQDAYAPSLAPRRLSSPVIVNGEVKSKVELVPGTGKTTSAPADTIVAKPLAAMYLGGINPKSRMYKAYAKRLAALGSTLVPLQGGLSSKVSTYDADFEPGSAIAVLAARGDLWFGGIGTVTYTDADNVVAFGHPAFWEGDTGLFMCNAWIDGVWPSAYEAYKLGRPATLRGTLTQDRFEGVVGIDGQLPSEAVVTARATNDAGKVATSSVEIPTKVINSDSPNFYGIATEAAWIAGSRVFNSAVASGSADTTTTIKIVDTDTSEETTITRVNHYSDPNEIAMAGVTDVDQMVGELQAANANGIAHLEILSVDLDATYHKARSEGEIVSVDVPGGLRSGLNTATVSLLAFGTAATQTVDATFTIPAGVPLTGNLTAFAVNDGGGNGSFSDMLGTILGTINDGSAPTTDRRTVADVINQLNNAVDNTTIDVSFQPVDAAAIGDGSGSAPTPTVTYDAIDTTKTTAWVVRSSAEKTSPAIDAFLDQNSYLYGDTALVEGDVMGVDGSGKITVYGTDVPTSTVAIKNGSFFYETPTLKHTTTLHFSFAGDAHNLPAKKDVLVKVAALTMFKTSTKSTTVGHTVTLSSEVLPHNAGGSVAFQKWDGFEWTKIKTVALPPTGKVSWGYKLTKKGSVKVRARYLGSAKALASSSGSVTVKVK